MRSRILCGAGIAAVYLMIFGAVALAASVAPVLYDPWTSGDAEFELGEIGCTADYGYKVDNWDEGDPSGDYDHEGNTITITAHLDGGEYKTFDWTSLYPVCCVIVKAGTKAYVFWYPEGSYGDTGLYAPDGKAISHATFGFDRSRDVPTIPAMPLIAIPVAVSAAAIVSRRRR